MSRKGKNGLIVLSLIFMYACGDNSKNKESFVENNLRQKAILTIGSKQDYVALYEVMSDTLSIWIDQNVLSDSVEDELHNNSLITTTYKIDSTYVINSSKNKIVGSIFQISKHSKSSYSHGIHGFYGARIKGKWFFWLSGYTPIYKSQHERNTRVPMSYKQLHHMSIGSLSGYLDQNGNIRNQWFEAKFSGDGWPSFEERYEYEYILDGARIDNKKDYWNYLWKKKGTMLWSRKSYQDSLSNTNKKSTK